MERVRAYAGISETQALGAAERLLRLAGGDEAKIARSERGVTAEFNRSRRFYLFLVAHSADVHEHWAIATRPAPGGIAMCASIRGHYYTETFVFGADPYLNAVYPASERDPKPRWWGLLARAYAVNFDTFWGRLDYLLGLSPVWPDCSASGAVRRNDTRGRDEMNPLCHRLAENPAPPAIARNKPADARRGASAIILQRCSGLHAAPRHSR